MNHDNVVPFRPRPPTKAQLEVYKSMTRLWHPEVKQRMFPEYFRCAEKDVEAGIQSAEPQITG